ncbi:serine/threonine-protein kinase [Leucobacter chromiireducens]|uniref:serine/threonine-protein kinase n=1 Tax=Leucobacter chromiireducens TaxID=283877 RepID=UPI003075B586
MAAQRAVDQPSIPGLSYVRPLGSGGFAQVHLYEQDLPRRSVAVKVIDTAPQGREAFEREADAMAALSGHPSIVSIYQAGIALSGRPYLVMEYCPASMGALTKGRPARLVDVLDAGVRLAGALETAHRAGVLHRDIKPSNVLLTTLGRPALSDFGIARALHAAEVPAEEVAMSVPWSAPEVVRLVTPGTVASEVWSLAATLYTFAAGRSPFEEASRERNTRAKLIARIGKATILPIPGASGYGPFDAVLARAMRRTPAERYATMAEFGRALQELQRGYGFDVTPLEIVADAWVPVPGPGTSPEAAAGEVPGELDGAGDADDSAAPPRRGPVVSEVPGRRTRAQERAERDAARTASTRHPSRTSRGIDTDADGVVRDRPMSPLRAGLIGAGIALATVAAALGVVWAVTGGVN